MPQPTDLEGMEWVGLLATLGCEVDDAMAVGIADKLPVELGPVLGIDLAFERPLDVEIRPQAKFLCNQILRAGAHTLLDVVAGDDEVLAVVGDAAHDDVDVRMLGVPVVNRDPIELGAEVLLDLASQLAGETLEVGHLRRVIGRDDEAEVMSVLLAPLGEGVGVGIFRVRAEQPGLLAVPGDALAPEIAEMGESGAELAACLTTRVLIVTIRERPVSSRFARTVATRPRPKRDWR